MPNEVFALVSASARYATPLLFAASGGAICERGGIVNIALEGLLLVGAYASIACAVHGGGLVGVGGAVLAGVALAGVHALVTIRWKVNQIVSGVASSRCVFGDCATRGRVASTTEIIPGKTLKSQLLIRQQCAASPPVTSATCGASADGRRIT